MANAVPLKYLSISLRSPKIPLINCKIELRLKWTKYCVLSEASADYKDASSNNIIFTLKDTQLYVPVVALSAPVNQRLLKLPSKGFERSFSWNEWKTKSDNKNATNECRYFLK